MDTMTPTTTTTTTTPTATATPYVSDRELFAHYKRIAPRAELAFSRRHASPELQAEIDAITKPTAKDAAAIRTKRRGELAAAEREAGEPPIGCERWATALRAAEAAAAEAATMPRAVSPADLAAREAALAATLRLMAGEVAA